MKRGFSTEKKSKRVTSLLPTSSKMSKVSKSRYILLDHKELIKVRDFGGIIINGGSNRIKGLKLKQKKGLETKKMD